MVFRPSKQSSSDLAGIALRVRGMSRFGDPYYSKSAHKTLEATPLPGEVSQSICGLSEPRPTLRPCQQALGLRAALRQTMPAIL